MTYPVYNQPSDAGLIARTLQYKLYSKETLQRKPEMSFPQRALVTATENAGRTTASLLATITAILTGAKWLRGGDSIFQTLQAPLTLATSTTASLGLFLADWCLMPKVKDVLPPLNPGKGINNDAREEKISEEANSASREILGSILNNKRLSDLLQESNSSHIDIQILSLGLTFFRVSNRQGDIEYYLTPFSNDYCKQLSNGHTIGLKVNVNDLRQRESPVSVQLLIKKTPSDDFTPYGKPFQIPISESKTPIQHLEQGIAA